MEPSAADSRSTLRVLVVDDSPLFAQTLVGALEEEGDIAVVAVAVNGRDAVESCCSLRPDLVVLDIFMPVMNGLDATEEIMASSPTPILITTADARGRSGELALEAVRRGALDLVMKDPGLLASEESRARLREHLRFLASVSVVGRPKGRRDRAAVRPAKAVHRARAIGIVTSTGGPAALERILSELPAELAAGIAVVQHLADGFAPTLASWLNSVTRLRVELARPGSALSPGTVLIAPDGHHLRIDPSGNAVLGNDPPRLGHRPSGDFLLESIASSFGRRGMGVVLTGMGDDGAQGLLALHRAGGATLAQDEESSIIFGMPRAAIEAGAAQRTAPLGGIAEILVEAARGKPLPSESGRGDGADR